MRIRQKSVRMEYDQQKDKFTRTYVRRERTDEDQLSNERLDNDHRQQCEHQFDHGHVIQQMQERKQKHEEPKLQRQQGEENEDHKTQLKECSVYEQNSKKAKAFIKADPIPKVRLFRWNEKTRIKVVEAVQKTHLEQNQCTHVKSWEEIAELLPTELFPNMTLKRRAELIQKQFGEMRRKYLYVRGPTAHSGSANQSEDMYPRKSKIMTKGLILEFDKLECSCNRKQSGASSSSVVQRCIVHSRSSSTIERVQPGQIAQSSNTEAFDAWQRKTPAYEMRPKLMKSSSEHEFSVANTGKEQLKAARDCQLEDVIKRCAERKRGREPDIAPPLRGENPRVFSGMFSGVCPGKMKSQAKHTIVERPSTQNYVNRERKTPDIVGRDKITTPNTDLESEGRRDNFSDGGQALRDEVRQKSSSASVELPCLTRATQAVRQTGGVSMASEVGFSSRHEPPEAKNPTQLRKVSKKTEFTNTQQQSEDEIQRTTIRTRPAEQPAQFPELSLRCKILKAFDVEAAKLNNWTKTVLFPDSRGPVWKAINYMDKNRISRKRLQAMAGDSSLEKCNKHGEFLQSKIREEFQQMRSTLIGKVTTIVETLSKDCDTTELD